MPTAAERLSEVLEQERAVLSGGKLDQLEDIVEQKDALVGELAGLGPTLSEGELERLQRLVSRNEALLSAARRGLGAAIDRISERARLARQLDTYDSAGQRTSLSAGGGELSRRY